MTGLSCRMPDESHKEIIMGEIRVKVKLTNSNDVTRHRLGALAKHQIRMYEADAMVDTGAVRSVIPSHVLEKLGIGIRGTRVAEYSNGRKESVGMSEGIIFDTLGRDTLGRSFDPRGRSPHWTDRSWKTRPVGRLRQSAAVTEPGPPRSTRIQSKITRRLSPMASDPEARVAELNLTLPPAPKAVAVYKTAIQVGNLLFVSGHGPYRADKTLITGRLGQDMTLDQGQEAARQTGLAILATVRDTLGSLNKIKRLVKTFGMVNCTDDFLDQPKVINGYSELMKEIFGDDAGVGARSAVGHNSLPGNIAVEIECIFEVV